MSRIDKALRAWEDSVGVASREPEAFTTHARTLDEYATEPSQPRPRPLDDRRPTAPPPAPDVIMRPPDVITRPPVAPREHRQPAAAPTASAAAVVVEPRHSDRAAARLVPTTPHAFSVEQYRRLAATLHDAQSQGGLKSVLITSAAPREGKTLTGVNLAFTLSDSYARRVLLVDADLRCPGVHALLGLQNQRGLNEALNEDCDLPVVDVSPRLSVLTAGCPESPLASLSSGRMRSLLEECERRYDWVVVDTPPVGVLPDAQLLTRLAGAVVLVIGANTTPAALVARAIAELEPERIIGIVLNRVEPQAISDANYVKRYYANAKNTGAPS